MFLNLYFLMTFSVSYYRIFDNGDLRLGQFLDLPILSQWRHIEIIPI